MNSSWANFLLKPVLFQWIVSKEQISWIYFRRNNFGELLYRTNNFKQLLSQWNVILKRYFVNKLTLNSYSFTQWNLKSYFSKQTIPKSCSPKNVSRQLYCPDKMIPKKYFQQKNFIFNDIFHDLVFSQSYF